MKIEYEAAFININKDDMRKRLKEFLEPFVEIEGKSEKAVKDVSEKLGFNWHDARFCAIDALYADKYGVSENVINCV